jgi:hypothetical protein
MKFMVAGVLGSVLLFAVAAAGGIYVTKLTKPLAPVTEEKINADQAYFTRNLIELRAGMSDALSSKDAFRDLRQIARRFRLASGRYFWRLKSLPGPSTQTIDASCLTEADEALEKMTLAALSVHSCEHTYFRTSGFCSSKERTDASDYLSRQTGEVRDALSRCLEASPDIPITTGTIAR